VTKRTPEQWQALFAEHQASGLSQAQFCKQQGLCPKYFSVRRKQLLVPRAQATPPKPFIQAQAPIVKPNASVSIYYQGEEIRLHQVDVNLIVAVIKKLA